MSKAGVGITRHAVAGLALAFLALGLAGCGSSDDDKNYVERPVEQLYNQALNELSAQEYK